MKKKFLLLAALSFSLLSFAQTKPAVTIKVGAVNAGLRGDAVENLQNLIDYSNGAVTTTGRTGFYGGASVNIPVTDKFSIEPGLLYTQKGYEMNGSLSVKGTGFLSANAKAALNMSYVDVPLLLKGTFNGFQVFGGPQVSYLTNARLRTTAGALGFNFINTTLDAKSGFNNWDVALTGGVGYGFQNGFSVSAAYDHGLSKVDANRNLSSYNRAVKVGVGFRF